VEGVADDGQGAAGALPPVVAAQGDAVVVEADPGAAHQLRVHQDEPAVGVVLGGAGLAGQVGAQAELVADGHAGAPVHHAAHHVEQGVGHARVRAASGRRGELLQHLAVRSSMRVISTGSM
jgi:hypothetical protein